MFKSRTVWDDMYEQERTVFRLFKTELERNEVLRSEVESAIEVLLSEYNTTIHENRFVVGGVLERIIGAAMRAAGIDATNVGKVNPRIDISVPGAEGFSVKGGFTGAGPIRLINVLGGGVGGGWREATIFVLTGIGIGYADPELLPEATVSSGDAVLLKRRNLTEFLARQPEYLLRCEIAQKSADLEHTRMASEAVAHELLERFPTLRQFK